LKFFNRFYDITWFGAVCSSIVINTHYIHSVVVQYFVSGRAFCVNKNEMQQITWRHAQNVISSRVLYTFVNLISNLVICLKVVFIELLDKLITYIVCWYKTENVQNAR
jgi:hypothetical protein